MTLKEKFAQFNRVAPLREATVLGHPFAYRYYLNPDPGKTVTLVMQVALKTKYRGMDIDLDAAVSAVPDADPYEFYFELAGIWKMTELWMAESTRKTPEKMSHMIVKIWEQ
jgi:hypothetical protein